VGISGESVPDIIWFTLLSLPARLSSSPIVMDSYLAGWQALVVSIVWDEPKLIATDGKKEEK
jgi:hypothetical protein